MDRHPHLPHTAHTHLRARQALKMRQKPPEEDIRVGHEKMVQFPWAATGWGLTSLLALPSPC